MIIYDDKVILKKIISGGQTGADQAGLHSAKSHGFETGGYAPAGFRTLAGKNPAMLRDEFKLTETTQGNYQVRTAMNVRESDATIRLATNYNSPGELCTMNAIRKYKKPVFDVHLLEISERSGADREAYINSKADEFIRFLIENQVIVLNVAGNADRFERCGYGPHFHGTVEFLDVVLKKIKNDSR